MSNILSPNFSTSFFPYTGPMPLTRPLPRYFSIPSRVVGRGARQKLGAELGPELPVLHPPALGRKPLARVDRWQRADHRHLVAVPFGVNLEHREPVLLIEEGNALNQSG